MDEDFKTCEYAGKLIQLGRDKTLHDGVSVTLVKLVCDPEWEDRRENLRKYIDGLSFGNRDYALKGIRRAVTIVQEGTYEAFFKNRENKGK